MFTNKEVIFGTVSSVSADNSLTVLLENGETGRVARDEIGRRELKDNVDLSYMVGRTYGYFAGDADEDGCRILSGKAYENDQYQKIVDAFNAGVRNVYTARFSSVTRDGGLAFYTLAQGVNASMTLSDFAYTYLPSFASVRLPHEMTVAVKGIDEQGRIRIYAKLGFGDFAANVDRLNLEEGSMVEGIVSGHVTDRSDAIVALTPNLTILTGYAPKHSRVKVKVTAIDRAEQRIRGEIVSDYGMDHAFLRFDEWCVGAEQYPAYVDVQAFESRLGPTGRTSRKLSVGPADIEEVDIGYETSASVSPFAVREGETVIRSAINGGTTKKILFESQHGYLSDVHRLTAQAVNDLRYTTSWQVQRYLDMKYGMKLTEKKLWNVLTRLIKLDILHAMHFSKDGQAAVQHILYPGATMYTAYTGASRSLPTSAYSAEPDPAMLKCCLSANQLLLGMMHGWDNVQEINTRVFLTGENVRIRPRHKVTTCEGDIVYLESARGGWTDSMLEKLRRYDTYLQQTGEAARVAVTLEDEIDVELFVQQVAGLRLSYPVMVTCDLKCLPAPVMREVPAYVCEVTAPEAETKSGFFSRFRSLFRDRKAA